MAVGGSLLEVTIDGRTFSVAGDSGGDPKLGGFENAHEANGDSTVRQIKTRVPWSVTDLNLQVDDLAGDQEFLQERANAPGFFDCTFTFASGAVYNGQGNIEGEIKRESQKATAPIGIMGTGVLTKQ